MAFDQALKAALPGNQMLSMENLTEVAYECKQQRMDEAWMHDACLTIAETGQKWGDSVHPSPAMKAVYDLYRDRELLRQLNATFNSLAVGHGLKSIELQKQVNALIESCYYRTKAGKVHWVQGKYFGTSIADDTDSKAFMEAIDAIRRNAGISECDVADDAGSDDPLAKPSTLATEIAARVWCDQEMQNIVMDVGAATKIARIIDDVRREQCDAQSYADLAASGGIVDAP